MLDLLFSYGNGGVTEALQCISNLCSDWLYLKAVLKYVSFYSIDCSRNLSWVFFILHIQLRVHTNALHKALTQVDAKMLCLACCL